MGPGFPHGSSPWAEGPGMTGLFAERTVERRLVHRLFRGNDDRKFDSVAWT